MGEPTDSRPLCVSSSSRSVAIAASYGSCVTVFCCFVRISREIRRHHPTNATGGMEMHTRRRWIQALLAGLVSMPVCAAAATTCTVTSTYDAVPTQQDPPAGGTLRYCVEIADPADSDDDDRVCDRRRRPTRDHAEDLPHDH